MGNSKDISEEVNRQPVRIVVGQRYRYKGREYTVQRFDPGNFLTKDADSGNWQDAVEYTVGVPIDPAERPSDTNQKRFVRSAEDFANKFEQVF